MPKKSEAAFESITDALPEVRERYNVIIDGEDRVFYARDKADLDEQVARFRAHRS